MPLASLTRRVAVTFRALQPATSMTVSKREWIALTIAGLMLLQPLALMAQRGRVATAPSSSGLQKGKEIISPKPPAPSAALTSGNLVIYRVGTGAAALNANATAVFLDEYATSGGSPVQSIAMPTADSGANQTLTASGSASSEGLLTRSTDGNYLVLTGYDAAVGTASITTSGSSTLSRVIGRVSAAGTVDTTTAITDVTSGATSAGNPRSAVSTNGTDLWMDSSVNGIRYTTLGSTTSTQLSTTVTNLRQANIFNGQLYVSSQSGAFRLSTVGSGTPTTSGQTTTNLPAYPTATTSPYGFFFADLDSGVAGVDTVYVADDNSAGGTGGIQKYSLVAGNWTANGSIANTTGLRGLTGVVSGNNVTLYTTSASALLTVTDTTGYNATITGSLSSIATAATNTAFRGVALAPGDAAPSVSSTTPTNGATGVAPSTDITVTFSEPVNVTGNWLQIVCGSSGTRNVADTVVTGGPTTFTINPNSDFTAGEACTATVFAAQVTDQDAVDPPDNMAANFVFSFTVAGADTAPSVSSTTPTNGASGVAANTDLTATFSEPVNVTGNWFQIVCGSSGTRNVADTVVTGGPTTFTINPNSDFTAGETCTVTVFAAQVADQDAVDPPDNMSANFVFSFTIAVPITSIHSIQGNGTTSPLAGSSVTTRGIVTGLRGNGFFIQEPDATVDADPNTSEGIFVFTSSAPPAGAAIGNSVQVSGTVQEFSPPSDLNQKPQTELSGTISVSVLTTGNSLPAASTITAADTVVNNLENLERYEGMRVTVPSMTVVAPTQGTITESSATVASNGVFYGVVTGVARPFREPGVNASDTLPPGSPANVPRFDENPERLRVDSDAQPGTTALNVSAGSVLTNVTGELEYAFRTWTIDPETTVTGTNGGATPVPTPTANEFTIASFNMERFFDTVNDPNKSDAVLTQAALDKRLNKASLIIRNVQRYPDVIGVEEMENLSTLQMVAAKVNSDAQTIDGLPNPNYVAYLVEGNDIGGIDVGFLVKESRITTVSVTQIELAGCDHITGAGCYTYTNPNTGGQELLNDRPPLVLTATVPRPAGGTLAFTVIVNHLRSLSSIDDDVTVNGTGTEGGRVRAKRKAQAEFLANYIQSRQTSDATEKIITVGDMNAFRVNDGYVDMIDTILGTPVPDDQTVVAGDGADLVNPNQTDLVDTLTADQQYSYSFDGNAQTLDHIIVNPNALAIKTRFAYAREDADQPVKDYEDGNIPDRISDHDQPVAYFSLTTPQPQGSVIVSEFRFRGPGGTTDEFVELCNNTDSSVTVSTTDGSAGWALVGSDGVTRFVVPNGTVIPGRGHYLGTNSSAYSLAGYAAGDATYTTDIPENGGIALFRTANAVNFTLSERLDAAGYTGVTSLYREGAGFPTGGPETSSNLDYSFLRSMTKTSGGLPKDTGDNAADFIAVDTNGTVTGMGQHLGAPGPENLSSPVNRTGSFSALLLDTNASSSAAPNRTRDFTPVTNGNAGTMEVRRTFTNNTGASVTRLRFRIVDITTFPSPAGTADLRALDSTDTVVTVNSIPVNVRGTTVEQPPTQAFGGGWNSSMNVGFITLGSPLANGSSVSVRFRLGVMQAGTFRFLINIEALP